MQYLSNDAIEYIDSARDEGDALWRTGQIKEVNAYGAHFVRLAYIKTKRGYRAVGGFFVETRANVTRKFCEVWNEDNSK